jgi:hypothetical protein
MTTSWLHQLPTVDVSKYVIISPKSGQTIYKICILNLCCIFGTYRKTQSWCWLALQTPNTVIYSGDNPGKHTATRPKSVNQLGTCGQDILKNWFALCRDNIDMDQDPPRRIQQSETQAGSDTDSIQKGCLYWFIIYALIQFKHVNAHDKACTFHYSDQKSINAHRLSHGGLQIQNSHLKKQDT